MPRRAERKKEKEEEGSVTYRGKVPALVVSACRWRVAKVSYGEKEKKRGEQKSRIFTRSLDCHHDVAGLDGEGGIKKESLRD